MSNRQSKIDNRKSNQAFEVVTASVEETQAVGQRLGRLLRGGDVVALHGELGSGKTTFIQGIAQGAGQSADAVKSPTFVLQREYPGRVPLIHIDGYRLEGAQQAAWLDTDLMFSGRKATLIEWAERFEGLLPDDHLEVRLDHVSTNRRRITVRATGLRSRQLLEQLQHV
jgi:tRNA threonylcarbamoyladenosine biosynthesis protein TsaE